MAGNLVIDSINGVNISVSPPATQAYANSYDLGVGQTWQDVTASRVSGTTYTNSTGKPISINIYCTITSSSYFCFYVNNIQVLCNYSTATVNLPITFIIPNNGTYELRAMAGSPQIVIWSELR